MSEGDFLAYQRAVQRGAFPSTRDHETIIAHAAARRHDLDPSRHDEFRR